MRFIIITNIIQYAYYRIVKALNATDDEWTIHFRVSYATGYLCGCLFSNIVIIVAICRYFIFSIPVGDTIRFSYHYVFLPFVLISLFILPNEKSYERLEQKYKDEQHRSLKGWLVAAYLIFSILSPIAIYIFV